MVNDQHGLDYFVGCCGLLRTTELEGSLVNEERYMQYDYFAHIALRTGYREVVPVTRIPEPDEAVEEWLEEECRIARVADKIAGVLYISHIDDLALVGFHREEKKQQHINPVPDAPPEVVVPDVGVVQPASSWRTGALKVHSDVNMSDMQLSQGMPVNLSDIPPGLQKVGEHVAKMMQQAMRNMPPGAVGTIEVKTRPEDEEGEDS